jgi:hypothetical protein
VNGLHMGPGGSEALACRTAEREQLMNGLDTEEREKVLTSGPNPNLNFEN